MKSTDNQPVIVAGLRTPLGKLKGSLGGTDAFQMGAAVLKGVLDRSGWNPANLDDVIMGNLLALPGNVARVAALEAGIPQEVPAQTVDRQCASGLEAVNLAAALIQAGRGTAYLAGGTESMTRGPYYMEKSSQPFSPRPPRFLQAQISAPSVGDPSMIQTADNVARRYEIGREEQDRFALESHTRALKARDTGVFAGQIIPAPFFCSPPGAPEMTQDETPRPETSMDKLAGLKPLLGGDSTVTAGNSCPMNDGAAALLVTSRGEAEKKGYPWMVRLVDYAVSGLDPHYMGLGPVYAVRKLLARTGLALKDVDIVELNEAFAAQSLACIRELDISPDQLNPHGGAIALGHPLGATGAILAVKLIHAMEASRARYGVVTMCIGGGQGVAALFEAAGEGV